MSSQSGKWAEAIQKEASEWVAREDEFTAVERAEFLVWLRRSPAHVEEFLRAEATWAALTDYAGEFRDEVSALLLEAQNHSEENVIPLQYRHPPIFSPADQGNSKRPFWYACAASLLLSAAVLFSHFWFADAAEHYATAIGEQRRIQLSDGSIVELNTASAISVRMAKSERVVHLEAGEAFFVVAKDAQRPFRVFSHTAVAQAIGTQFDVYRQPTRTAIGVVEGKVMVTRRASSDARQAQTDTADAPIELQVGDSVTVGGAGESKVIEASAERLSAWRQRRLVFDNDRLETVVAEFNRYNVQQIVILDVALADQRISGVFDANKPQGLVRFLTMNKQVRVSVATEKQQILTIVR